MVKILLISSLFLTSLSICFAQKGKSKAYLKKVLEKEMKSTKRLIKIKKDANSAYRYFTVRTEYLKIIKEEENRKFLKKIKNSKVPKSNFLRKSFALYKELRAYGLKFEKRFPRFKYIDEFHLIYGLLIYEFEEKSAEGVRYLKRAFKETRRPEIKELAAANIADFYFNNENFKQSLKYYSWVVKRSRDQQWLPKYKYNLAWSAFKIEKYNIALKWMENIYINRKKKYYRSFADQSLSFLPTYYVYGGKIKEGVGFIIKNISSKEKNESFFNLFDVCMEKGLIQKGNYVKKSAVKYFIQKKKKRDLFQFQLKVFNRSMEQQGTIDFVETEKIFNYLVKNKRYFKPQEEKEFISNVENFIRAKANYFNEHKYTTKNKLTVQMVKINISFLRYLYKVQFKKRNEYLKTLIDIFIYKEDKYNALRYCKKSIKETGLKKADNTIVSRTLFLYEELKKDKRIKSKERITFYEAYVSTFPRRKNSQEVFRKVYAYYLKRRKYGKCFSLTKFLFAKNLSFLKSNKIFITKLMDIHLNKKDLNSYGDVLDFAKNPRIGFNQKFLRKALQNYQLLELEIINKIASQKKDPKVIQKLKGYFYGKKVSLDNRLVAGHNALVLLLEFKRIGEFNTLFKNWIKDIDRKNFGKYNESINSFYDFFIFTGQLEDAQENTKVLYTKSCKFNGKNKVKYYAKLSEYYLINQEVRSYLSHIYTYKACQIDRGEFVKIVEADWEKRFFLTAKDYFQRELIQNRDSFSIIKDTYAEEQVINWFNNYATSKEQKKKNLLSNVRRKPVFKYISNYVPDQEFLLKFKQQNRKNSFKPLALPEEKFMQVLEGNLNLLSQKQASLLQVVNRTNQRYDVKLEALFFLRKISQDFLDNLNSFNPPKGTAPETIEALGQLKQQFNQEMGGKVRDFNNQYNEYYRKSRLLSKTNFLHVIDYKQRDLNNWMIND